MKYLPYEIDANEGDIVEVRLDRAANVRLLDPRNYAHYREGHVYEHAGGYVTVSPFRLVIPSSGRWYLVIDLGGGPGQVQAAVSLQSGRAA